MEKPTIVLGAGAAGLATAWELVNQGKKVIVLERSPLVGGLASYVKKNSNIYEYGTHVFHTDSQSLKERVLQLMGDRMFAFERAGRLHIKFRDKYFRYPLNGLDILLNLPITLSLHCVLSLLISTMVWKISGRKPANSADVLKKHFGTKLYDIFFKEYTHKFWGKPCEDLDKVFALERIPRSDVFKIIHDVFEKLGIGQMFSGHNLTERALGSLYYCKNGIHELMDTIADYIRAHEGVIETGVILKKINIENGSAKSIEYMVGSVLKIQEVQAIISTIPLKHFIPLFSQQEQQVVQAAKKLEYLPLTVCGLLVKKKSVRNAICTYYRESIFNRLSEPTIHGLVTVPSDRSLLLAELSDYSLNAYNVKTDEEIIGKVIDGIIDLGLLNRDEIEDTCLYRYEEAYPIYHVGFEEDLKVVNMFFKKLRNVYSTGRQGAFRYVNTHATMQMGISTVQSMVKSGVI